MAESNSSTNTMPPAPPVAPDVKNMSKKDYAAAKRKFLAALRSWERACAGGGR